MSNSNVSLARISTLLAINLLYLMVWGFAGIGKLLSGVPQSFHDQFGATLLGRFPGVTASFWLVAAAELAAFTLAAAALLRCEFLAGKAPRLLEATVVWSLFVFLQLGFGLWLTHKYEGGFQQFMYFGATLVALQHVK